MASEFSKSVCQVVQKIPKGYVCSYGQVAALAGNPRAARGVGFVLHHGPANTPCHRVVFQDGSTCQGFAFGGAEGQKQLLRAEGVPFLPDGRVDLTKGRWRGEKECC